MFSLVTGSQILRSHFGEQKQRCHRKAGIINNIVLHVLSNDRDSSCTNTSAYRLMGLMNRDGAQIETPPRCMLRLPKGTCRWKRKPLTRGGSDYRMEKVRLNRA